MKCLYSLSPSLRRHDTPLQGFALSWEPVKSARVVGMIMAVIVCALIAPLGAAANEIPVAVLSGSGTNRTLTFTFADSAEVDHQTVFALLADTATDRSGDKAVPQWWPHRTRITKVVFAPEFGKARPTSTYRWFHEMENLTAVEGMDSLNTVDVTDMQEMFYGCSALTSLTGFACFDTRKVRNMSGMFRGCQALTELNVVNIKTDNAEDLSYMFSGCSSLTALDVSRFDTRRATSMRWMFASCKALAQLDVSGFSTENVTNFESMFTTCSALTEIDVSNFDTRNATSMAYMFNSCGSLTELDLRNFTFPPTANIRQIAGGCTALTSLYIGDNDFSDMQETGSSVKYFVAMGAAVDATLLVGEGFSRSVLGEADADGKYSWRGGKFLVKDAPVPMAILRGDDNEKTLHFTLGDKSSIDNTTTFALPDTTQTPGWATSAIQPNVVTVSFSSEFAKARPVSTANWFAQMNNLNNIVNLHFLNTSKVTTMNSMFAGCKSLEVLDVSHFDTRNVIRMKSMFQSCWALETLNLSSFNTEKVINMETMFLECRALKRINLSSFNTEKVLRMYAMFYGCTSLTSLDLRSFTITSSVNTSRMCSMCPNIKVLYIGKNSMESGDLNNEAFKRMNAKLVADPGFDYSVLGVKGDDGKYTWLNGTFELDEYPAVVLSGSGYSMVLTLTYADEAQLATDTAFPLSEMGHKAGWQYYSLNIILARIAPEFAKARPTSTSFLFNGMTSLTDIVGMEYLNTSEVVDMKYMFYNCPKLTNIDLSHFDTRKVKSMMRMFTGCTSLTGLDISQFTITPTTDVTQMAYMCSGLSTLNVGNNDFADNATAEEVFTAAGTDSNPVTLTVGDDFPLSALGRIYPNGINQWLGGTFFLDDPTSIASATDGNVGSALQSADGAWYTTGGVRLHSRPTTPGIYIHGRRTVVIR